MVPVPPRAVTHPLRNLNPAMWDAIPRRCYQSPRYGSIKAYIRLRGLRADPHIPPPGIQASRPRRPYAMHRRPLVNQLDIRRRRPRIAALDLQRLPPQAAGAQSPPSMVIPPRSSISSPLERAPPPARNSSAPPAISFPPCDKRVNSPPQPVAFCSPGVPDWRFFCLSPPPDPLPNPPPPDNLHGRRAPSALS